MTMTQAWRRLTARMVAVLAAGLGFSAGTAAAAQTGSTEGVHAHETLSRT
ncbi:MAG: hypothetical protein HKL99_11965 [Burkholderiales bacterium]|jgi:hypothetical protein|nr:hypothetical protein [Burkholderiales bacterium]